MITFSLISFKVRDEGPEGALKDRIGDFERDLDLERLLLRLWSGFGERERERDLLFDGGDLDLLDRVGERLLLEDLGGDFFEIDSELEELMDFSGACTG